MTDKKRTASRWQRLATIADAQHGVISRDQMRKVGFKDGAITHTVTTGRLHHVFRGVYALGHRHPGERGRLMAAVLACGKGAVVSHRSAGALLELLDEGPAVIDAIAPGSRGRKIDGIRFHRVRPPRMMETGTMHGIPCTSPARTLVDLAGTVGAWTLGSAFERAAQRRMLDIAAIEVDFLWPDHRFVLEADSRAFHTSHVASERDRWRDRELMRAGYSVLRVTHREAKDEPDAVADTIAARLRKSES